MHALYRAACQQALLSLCALLQFSIYPLELIRTRLAVCPPGTYRGISDCFARIVREEGWLAFYRGLTPSLVRARCAPGLGFRV